MWQWYSFYILISYNIIMVIFFYSIIILCCLHVVTRGCSWWIIVVLVIPVLLAVIAAFYLLYWRPCMSVSYCKHTTHTSSHHSLKPGSQYNTGTASVMSIVSVKGKNIFFTSQIGSLMLNFSTIWLVGCWLTLATIRWNRNQVYSSVILWTRLKAVTNVLEW